MIGCKKCGMVFKNNKGLASHIRQAHNLTSKDYYDLYLKQSADGICPICGKQTNFNSLTDGYYKYCSKKCANLSEERNKKISDSIMQNIEHREKSREARIKAANTMRGNDNDSKYEDLFEQALINLGITYIKKYDQDLRYPFQCDFYLPKTDTFIEINGYWSHDDHFFNQENFKDLIKLEQWKKKAVAGHKQYKNAINVWTVKDLKKFEPAKKNSLNYIVLWTLNDVKTCILYLEKGGSINEMERYY